ncbi:GntR family transcriptional regulator [Lichenibacterium minor]|uniref:GntR family transcriptional regulator n=1 Tax=Lichenibacterium minor TaxID=2316528 RepID=A0A4Q2U3L6_9HYPH|nr:GntR family transcriptional regulator [Lichenibacterium minor]RYC30368.1 GntR family transcriptional regulator [Lichenibacterium minor]
MTIATDFDAGPPMQRRSLHDDLVERLRDMIIAGTLPPGTRVHEGQIGAALGVSRTPLREALKFLASEGLIELQPGRGAVVRRLTSRDVEGMLDVLVALEDLAARLACRGASDAGIARIRALHDAMMGFYTARDRLEYYKLNQAIHSGLVALADNACLAETHAGIQMRLKRIRFIGNEEQSKWDSAVTEHAEMIVALEARDEHRLAAIVRLHLHRTWERVRDSV